MGADANLWEALPARPAEEQFLTLLSRPGVRIERIVSYGHASPEGFWYDQEGHEWVLLLQGAARLRLEKAPSEGEAGAGPAREVELVPGSYLDIPAHCRHRVEWTAPDTETVWLAVHYR